MSYYAIYPVEIERNGEMVNICPEGARVSNDGTKFIRNHPELSIENADPLQVLDYDNAMEFMKTTGPDGWTSTVSE